MQFENLNVYINKDIFFKLEFSEYQSLMQVCNYLNIDKNTTEQYLYEFYNELGDFNKDILIERWKLYFFTGLNDFGLGKELIPLYIIVRHFKPYKVLETGLGYGSSSIYILKALDRNKKENSKLISLGMPYLFEKKYKIEDGILVTKYPSLCKYWVYKKNYIWNEIHEFNNFDIFLHDSDHCAEYMYWELDQAFKNAKKGNIILVHDALNNNAFELVAEKYNKEIIYFQCVNNRPVNAVAGVLGVCKC